MSRQPFVSPLLSMNSTRFSDLDFGAVAVGEGLANLKKDLHQALLDSFSSIPDSFQAEMHELLDAYCGTRQDFYRLFYVPVWSFLHWIPYPRSVDESGYGTVRLAVQAHALSLFIHLWDDHLSDSQLPPDMLRIHSRTTAWQQFVASAHELCRDFGLDPNQVEWACSTYLKATHRPIMCLDLTEYEEQFRKEVAIWTLVPRLVGSSLQPEAGEALSRIIEQFAIAWRIIDDIQDIHSDIAGHKKTAVWMELPVEGRLVWESCRKSIAACGELPPEEWSLLTRHILESGCLDRLLQRIQLLLRGSADAARAQGWHSLAVELEQSLIAM